MRITKQQAKELAEHQRQLAECEQSIADAFTEAVTAQRDVFEPVNVQIRRYNEAVAAARTFTETVSEELRETFDSKSERWQEGDAGAVAATMVEAWEGVELEDVEELDVVEPDEPAVNDSFDPPEESE